MWISRLRGLAIGRTDTSEGFLEQLDDARHLISSSRGEMRLPFWLSMGARHCYSTSPGAKLGIDRGFRFRTRQHCCQPILEDSAFNHAKSRSSPPEMDNWDLVLRDVSRGRFI